MPSRNFCLTAEETDIYAPNSFQHKVEIIECYRLYSVLQKYRSGTDSEWRFGKASGSYAITLSGLSNCYGLNSMCAPQNLYVWILTSNRILGNGTFGTLLGYESKVLMNRISLLIKEARDSLACEDTEDGHLPGSGLHQTLNLLES